MPSFFTASKIAEIVKEVERIYRQEESKPLIISIMGQTGVGKSSLINALFGTDFRTDPIRPCTKEVERGTWISDDGTSIEFYDLPGIGESWKSDEKYIEKYREHIETSDILLWAISADTQDLTIDLRTLEILFLNSQKDEDVKLHLSKIVFVLTKADLLNVTPWIAGKSDEQVFYKPSEETERLLEERSSYAQKTILGNFDKNGLVISQTFNPKGGIELAHHKISINSKSITFNGLIDNRTYFELTEKYPNAQDVLGELYQNQQVIYCSTYFQYNLRQVLLSCVNKVRGRGIIRFKKFLNPHLANKISLEEINHLANIAIAQNGYWVYSIPKPPLENPILPIENMHFLTQLDVPSQKISQNQVEIVILGQTGVGKTSILDLLFEFNQQSGEKFGSEINVFNSYDKSKRFEIVAYEVSLNERLDVHKLSSLIQRAHKILWAIHSDNRAVTYDQDWIAKILSALSISQQNDFYNKLIFLLTKADLISPKPWIMSILNNNRTVVNPLRETQNILKLKAEYFEQELSIPFQKVNIKEKNALIIPVSSKFHYNILPLYRKILSNLGQTMHSELEKLRLTQVEILDAGYYPNFIIINLESGSWLYNPVDDFSTSGGLYVH